MNKELKHRIHEKTFAKFANKRNCGYTRKNGAYYPSAFAADWANLRRDLDDAGYRVFYGTEGCHEITIA